MRLKCAFIDVCNRQTDARVFKKYSQMKREVLAKLNRHAGESQRNPATVRPN